LPCPEAVRVIVELKPPETAVVIVAVPEERLATVIVVGAAERVKAVVCVVEVTVSETFAVWVRPPPMPVTVML
jgi:hypothetical protein